MILFILAAFMAYKKARTTGRSGILWALITAGVYIGTQLLFGLGIGLFLGVGVELFGWSETVYDDWNLLITAVCIIAPFGGIWLVFRYLDKLPAEQTFVSPPPPPTFEGK
jgi:ABC-type glycerol-3-phosphate transport system permease component